MIPYHIEINDSPAQLSRRHTANQFTEIVCGHFDEQMQPALPVPDIRSFRMLTDETLVICSDGLTDYAAKTHAKMADLMVEALKEKSPNEFCWNLTRHANAGGGGDNITIIACRLIERAES